MVFKGILVHTLNDNYFSVHGTYGVHEIKFETYTGVADEKQKKKVFCALKLTLDILGLQMKSKKRS